MLMYAFVKVSLFDFYFIFYGISQNLSSFDSSGSH